MNRSAFARPLRAATRRSALARRQTSIVAGLLAEAGCRVLKIESSLRPDGARRGPAGFFELLNGRKEHLSLDLPEPGAIAELQRLVACADLVLEASRPRVMQQWGGECR